MYVYVHTCIYCIVVCNYFSGPSLLEITEVHVVHGLFKCIKYSSRLLCMCMCTRVYTCTHMASLD